MRKRKREKEGCWKDVGQRSEKGESAEIDGEWRRSNSGVRSTGLALQMPWLALRVTAPGAAQVVPRWCPGGAAATQRQL